jgi:accessory gene regulator B
MHMMIETIVFTAAYIPVRIYAGGFHASNPQRCWAFSVMMLFVALCTAKYMPNKLFGLFTSLSLIACIVIFLLSPVEDKNKKLDKKEHHIYHFRTNCVLVSEIIMAFVLYMMHYKSIILIFDAVWCSLAIMLILGVIKNKKEEIDEQEN